MTYYKATKMDGTDFHTGKIDYTRVPLPEMSGKGEFPGSGWLHLATVPSECVGASWPCRLFEIEPASDAIIYMDGSHPHKIGASKAFVTREIESWKFFGPQGKEVVALIERAKKLDKNDIEKLRAAWCTAGYAAGDAARDAARDAAGDAAWYAARDAPWCAAWDAAGDAAWYAAWCVPWCTAGYAAGDAARTLISRDLIGKGRFTQEHYDALTIPWRQAIGKIHPDDEDLQKPNFDKEIKEVQSALDNPKTAIKGGK